MTKLISHKPPSAALTFKRSESDGCYQAYSSILKNFTENGHYIELAEILYNILTFVQQNVSEIFHYIDLTEKIVKDFLTCVKQTLESIKTENYTEFEKNIDKIIEFLSEANAVCKFTQNTILCQEIEQTLGKIDELLKRIAEDSKRNNSFKEADTKFKPTLKSFDDTNQKTNKPFLTSTCGGDKTSCDSKEVKDINDDGRQNTSVPDVDVKNELTQGDHSMPASSDNTNNDVDVATELQNEDIAEKLQEKFKIRMIALKESTERTVTQNGSEDTQKHHLVENLLKAAFEIGKNKLKLKQIDLEASLKSHTEAIDNTIYYHGNSFDIDYVPKYLVLRSGLQFLIDADPSFRAECESEDSYLHESIQLFDDGFMKWKADIDSSGFYNITHAPEDIQRPDDVPVTHTWWLENDG